MKSSLIKLVQEVGAQLEADRSQKNWQIIDKGIDGVATTSDIEAEKKIVQKLRELDPNIKTWGEEEGSQISEEEIKAGKSYWLIDPLDGTNNYINGLGIYCISIALCKGQEVELGLVYNPVEKTYFFAQKNQGAYYFDGDREIPINHQINKELKSCLFSPGRLRNKREIIGIEDHLDHLGQNCRAIRRLGAAAWEICLVAGGFLDGFWQYGLKPWDIAAGILIAKEANYEVRDFENNLANPLSKSLFVLPKSLSPSLG